MGWGKGGSLLGSAAGWRGRGGCVFGGVLAEGILLTILAIFTIPVISTILVIFAILAWK